MLDSELADLVARLRFARTDIADVEAKKAAGGLPKSVRETISAFQNTAGGVLVLGLDEESGFVATGIDDPKKISADLASLCAESFEPPVRPLIEVHEFEGAALVTAEVPALERSLRPSFYKGAGMTNGSYVRVNDADQRLTSYEVQMFLASRGQPTDDAEPVASTHLGDLDPALVRAYVERVRRTRPRTAGDGDEASVLVRTGAITEFEGELRPTLAGLLALGGLPQLRFPQLMVSFVHYPSADGAEADGTRFLDNVRVEGPIPVMVRDTLAALRRNMSRRAVVVGYGRADAWEYPEEALREAVVNALVHRDYSAVSRGAQVQVEMYPDRLVVRNPGGLFGPVTIQDLGSESPTSSSRNATLLSILEDVTVPGDEKAVVENRGSGIREMREALRRAGMMLPEFQDKISSFSVTFPNHALLGDDVIAWISTLGETDLTQSQITGLALLKQGKVIDNGAYRDATGVDSRVAYVELQDLVARELVVQTGSRRWATYRIADHMTARAVGRTEHRQRADRREEVLDALGDDTLTRAEIVARTGLSDKVVLRWLRPLREAGVVEAVGGTSVKSPSTKYRAIGLDRQDHLFSDR